MIEFEFDFNLLSQLQEVRLAMVSQKERADADFPEEHADRMEQEIPAVDDEHTANVAEVLMNFILKSFQANFHWVNIYSSKKQNV